MSNVSYELTDKSPVIGQPKEIIVPLTKYQKAILYKAFVEIENKGMKFGFMGDKPGAGKTAAILSLVAAEKVINKNSQTVIVVPQNLLNQWESEIKKFCSENIKTVVIDSYSLIREFYDVDNHAYYKSFDIILTTSTFYKLLQDTLVPMNYFVKRVIFDEVDSAESIFDAISIANHRSAKGSLYGAEKIGNLYQIVWYVSASIENLFDEDDVFKLGDIELSREEFWKHHIRCSDEFIKQYSLLDAKAIREKIQCDSVADIYSDMLSIEQLDFINSLSFNKIIGEHTSKGAKTEKETIMIIVEDYHVQHKNLLEEIKIKNEKLDSLRKKMRDTEKLEEMIKKDKSKEEFYKQCLCDFYKKINVNTFEEFKKEYEKYNFENSKLSKLLNYIENTEAKKVIIFSDYTNGFNHLFKYFDENKVSYTDLGKGNLKEISDAIEKYKNGDTKFLLIDSASEGCGLNLENTDEIIFIHRINEGLYEQMIGRALRPGRKGDLKVVTFLNKNEII